MLLRSSSAAIYSACIATMILVSGGSAVSEEGGIPVRFHLPQVSVRTSIEGEGHRLLRRFLSNEFEVKAATPLSPDVERFLLDALPAPYDNACETMVATWGLGARNVSSIRVLARDVGQSDSRRHILMAFRCACDPETFGKQYYDERMMSLSIGPGRTALEMIPHEPDRERDSHLSRIGIPGAMRFREGKLFAVPIETSSENPCCDGPYALEERKTFLLQLTGEGFKPVGEVLLSREEYEHDDVEGDRTTIYSADYHVVRDRTGNVVRIRSNFRVTRTEADSGRIETTEKGRKEFVFDGKERRFVPVR